MDLSKYVVVCVQQFTHLGFNIFTVDFVLSDLELIFKIDKTMNALDTIK